MPEYIYRREDGSTFTVRQKFLDDPLTVDPETGQKVVRVIQPTSVIFRGSGFYITDSKDASKKNLTTNVENGSSNGNGTGANSTENSTKSSTSSNGSSENGTASALTESSASKTKESTS